EVTTEPALTIRTSIIGRELDSSHGLVEWFLSQDGGTVRGFSRAIFSGWTTEALARVLREVLDEHGDLSGLYHVAAEQINKLDLLTLVRDAFDAKITIQPDDELVIDRSLDGTRFRERTGIEAPSWDQMIAELAASSAAYAGA